MSEPIRVVVIEDHALTRAGLRTALESVGFEVVAEAGDGISGLAAVTQRAPDVAVIDIGLPLKDGIALTREVKVAGLTTRVVIVTMHELEDEVFAALAAGADAYCVKSSDTSIVVDAVRTVAAGGAYFDPRVAHVVLGRFTALAADRPSRESVPNAIPSRSALTPREIDVLRLIAEGAGNADIAERLHIGLGTAKGHVRDILDKLSASDRAQAAVTAFRRGLL